jgi:hypothetical protein
MKVVLIAAAAIVLGTWLGAPVVTLVGAGLVIGFGWPHHAARHAAAAGALAWGGLLVAAALRGDAVATLGSTLGAAMGLPGWALFIVTILYPAILAASAAWLAHLVSRRRTPSIHPGAPERREHRFT